MVFHFSHFISPVAPSGPLGKVGSWVAVAVGVLVGTTGTGVLVGAIG